MDRYETKREVKNSRDCYVSKGKKNIPCEYCIFFTILNEEELLHTYITCILNDPNPNIYKMALIPGESSIE